MQIKRNVLAAGLVAGSMLMGSAHASYHMGFMDDMYLALDYQQSKLNMKTHAGIPYGKIYAEQHTAVVPAIGFKAHDMFDVEVSYFFSANKDRVVPATVTNRNTNAALNHTSQSKVRTFAIDGVTHYPVMDDVCLIGSLGLTRDQVKAHTPHNVIKRHLDSYGLRAGWGAAYTFNDSLSARLIGRVAVASLDSTNSSIINWGFGLTYAI